MACLKESLLQIIKINTFAYPASSGLSYLILSKQSLIISCRIAESFKKTTFANFELKLKPFR